jgi:GT2 family glycosyltransferase
MNRQIYRFERPTSLELVRKPKLSVAVIVACRGGQEKLDLLMASLAAQSYPRELTSIYIIDDGSDTAIALPRIKGAKSKLIRYKNAPSKWGKTAATNDVVAKIKADVFWFVDADMVFEKEHLAHHMKWHHNADDYAVLGWKRFVQEWNYTPQSAFEMISTNKFGAMHSESWGKKLWEDRVERTQDLRHPALDGYRAFVGATFSIKSVLWKKVGGYRRDLITGEDTELGWRLFMNGTRIVPERAAQSWHLGYSTVELNKEEIDRHNQPALAQYIPEMKKIRARSADSWKVPTYEVVIDVRSCKLSQLLEIRRNILSLPGTQADFILLACWKSLNERYSPVSDSKADLREIYNWLKGQSNFSFEEIKDENLSIEKILTFFTDEPIPFHIFVDGDFEEAFDGKALADYLLASENGCVGLASKQNHRALAVFHPALARSRSLGGSIYKELSNSWGVTWLVYEDFAAMSTGNKYRFTRATNFLKREGKKINSIGQLLIFIKKVVRILLRKILK